MGTQNPRKNGKPPYQLESAEDFQNQLYVLMDRIGGDVSMQAIAMVLRRAEHVVQTQIDQILDARVAQEADQEATEEGEQEQGETLEYPH